MGKASKAPARSVQPPMSRTLERSRWEGEAIFAFNFAQQQECKGSDRCCQKSMRGVMLAYAYDVDDFT